MKTYIEVACTIYKNVLVEVEHERTTEEEIILNLAEDAAREETGADDYEIVGVESNKPSRENMAMYDEFVQVNE